MNTSILTITFLSLACFKFAFTTKGVNSIETDQIFTSARFNNIQRFKQLSIPGGYVVTSAPTVVNSHASSMDLFFRDQNQYLIHAKMDRSGSISKATRVPLLILQTAPAVTALANGVIYAVTVSTGGNMFLSTYKNSIWTHQDIGGLSVLTPSIEATTDGHLMVYATFPDNSVNVRKIIGSNLGNWEEIHRVVYGGLTTVHLGANVVDIFGRSFESTLHENRPPSKHWRAIRIPGQEPYIRTTSDACVVRLSENDDVALFARGVHTNLMGWRRIKSTWSPLDMSVTGMWLYMQGAPACFRNGNEITIIIWQSSKLYLGKYEL